jgi:predicted short-subunit dehydrogenase-like oxidoreductase (DUF2520 family)
MTEPVRLSIGIVGTGRVGAVLGGALRRAGHRIVAASGVSAQSRKRAERLLPGVPLLAPDEVVQLADLVLLTVPDDALRPLVTGLAATGAWRAGHMVAHTSGANGISVLDAAAARGAVALALHPAMTFAGRPEDLDRLDGAVFGITAEAEFRPVAEALVIEIGGEPVWIPELARPVYHAALTHAANHLVTLLADAMQLLDEAGVEDPARMLAPLSGAALDNTLRLGDGALTGPISRGDARTVADHIAVLRRTAPAVLAPYLAMARRTTDRARDAGRITAGQHAALMAALAD